MPLGMGNMPGQQPGGPSSFGNIQHTSMLFKQKEQLKKDIAKKRAQLEKELSGEIAAEVTNFNTLFHLGPIILLIFR